MLTSERKKGGKMERKKGDEKGEEGQRKRKGKRKRKKKRERAMRARLRLGVDGGADLEALSIAHELVHEEALARVIVAHH